MSKLNDCPSTIAIIGSGEFARAIATRLYESRFNVVVGSRFPDRRKQVPKDDIFTMVEIKSVPECVKSSDLVIVAINSEHYSTLKPLRPLMDGKVVVDVSNSDQTNNMSNAEKLAAVFPKSSVVKAFNTIDAFAFQTMYQNRNTYVCGDDNTARLIVKQLANRLGFSAIDSGNLDTAANLENSNSKLFPGWGWPTFVLAIVTVIWIVYTFIRYFVMREVPYTPERVPTNVINKFAGTISITLLALTYIPGSIAAFMQLANGTKHKRFHKSLDRWLKMRKQLGLYALLLGALHTLMSISLLSPAYFSSWYLKKTATIPGNLTQDIDINIESRMSWIGETCVLLGFIAIFTMGLLGMVSIPSIANSMSWREWQCMQSFMGFVVLVFSVGHVTVKGASSWVDDKAADILPSMAFLSSLLPWFALALRLMLLTPCAFRPLGKIRKGWERNASPPVAIVIENGTYEEDGKVNDGLANDDDVA